MFGITVDAFGIGAGSVLFISALGMAQGKSAVQTDNVQQDVTIVPLTIPLDGWPRHHWCLAVMGISQPHWDDKLMADCQYCPGKPDSGRGAVLVQPD